MSELERKIFNDKAIQSLVDGINKNLQERNKVDDEKKEVITKELKQIDTQIVTEEEVRELLNNFSGYVISRNIPECKKFIQDFVKEVVVYKEHIEVIFNVSFSLIKNSEIVEVISKISRYELYERYSNSFYIKVS